MNAITKPDRRLEALHEVEARVLAAVQAGAPLAEALSALILGSVLLVSEDGKHLVEGAAPSLPSAYNAAINGVEIGLAVGSCGTAAFYGEPVFVSDIHTDPLWIDFRDLANEHGLRACWSMPIKDGSGRVIATFDNYYRQARHPRSADYEAIHLVANSVRQAIELSNAREIS
jgi:GAF domain-containing protein